MYFSDNKGIEHNLSNTEVLEKPILNTQLDTSTVNEYTKKLYLLFEEKKLYLRSDLSLDLLSEEINIPKHHLTQLFNTHLDKSYYQIVAEHRIAHAVKLLNENVNLTLESLAYECGYNSKTSFNRYFREQIGLNPSEYCNQLKVKS